MSWFSNMRTGKQKRLRSVRNGIAAGDEREKQRQRAAALGECRVASEN